MTQALCTAASSITKSGYHSSCLTSQLSAVFQVTFSTCSAFLEPQVGTKKVGTRYFYIMENQKRRVESVPCKGKAEVSEGSTAAGRLMASGGKIKWVQTFPGCQTECLLLETEGEPRQNPHDVLLTCRYHHHPPSSCSTAKASTHCCLSESEMK